MDIATLTETLATRMEDLRLVRQKDKDNSAALARTLLGHKQQQQRHEQGASECEAEIEATQTLLGEALTERDRCKAEQAEQEKVRGRRGGVIVVCTCMWFVKFPVVRFLLFCVRAREGDVCVLACVCMRENERDGYVYACVRACVYVLVYVLGVCMSMPATAVHVRVD